MEGTLPNEEEKVKRYIDLSGTLENGLWAYEVLPGLAQIIPGVSIETIATVKENDFFASRITLCTISGTYVEAGSHILESGKKLHEYSIEDFIKPARILRLPRQKAKALIDEQLLAKHAPEVSKGEALIIETGWGVMWNQPGYVLTCPNFTRRAIEWILERQVSICGFDVPCIESSWSEDVGEEKGGLLEMLFKRNVLLVAPLVNVDQVKGDLGTIFCLPLPVKGTSGAPARVIFEYEG